MNHTSTEVLNVPLADRVTPQPTAARPAIGGRLLVAAQLVLAAVLVHLYAIEGPAFQRIFTLAAAGFVVNLALPLSLRLPFFVGLSVLGAVIVFGVVDAAWLMAVGLLLIALCHLPLSFSARASMLVLAGAVLAVSRGGIMAAPWSATVWPILGSMFMFRLVLYLLANKTETAAKGPWWWPLAYFFMLPNLVFPLFPVVDYQTFRRTYYDRSEDAIHEQGMLWIARGMVHLLLYRFVYHGVLNDPEDVVRLSDLVQFMLGTFLLYLRVSGQFHLIVGILHLFGFRLPETHKLYYLASSFTELWRRINIYWTDFMMKTVFYPSYFRLKQRGPTAALVLSTLAVFVTTWFLHSYQWFWLRGGFPLTPQDTLFWAILGGLVIVGGLRELRAGKKPRRLTGGSSWDARLGLQAAATFITFCVLWSLWSAESLSLWIRMLGSAANVDFRGVLLVAVSIATVFVLGGIDWQSVPGPRAQWLDVATRPASRALAMLLLLLVCAHPAAQAAMPVSVAAALQSLRFTGLNARDLALQHRGYYEQLDVRAQLDTPVNAEGRKRDASWQTLDQLGVLQERRDLMLRDLLPSRRTTWNGKTFSTNQWGMRDQDYAQTKSADTLRIAMLGPSHVMGNNVADQDVFERLVEQRLNAEFIQGRYRRVEILNFGVDGYSLPQQLALMEARVFDFSPDVVIATHYKDNRDMTEGFLLKVGGQRLDVPDGELRALMASAGLLDVGDHGIPVPFAFARHAAGFAGVETRVPHGEARSLARRVSTDVLALSFRRFSEITRSRGIAPVVLALNVVIDDVPKEIPLRGAIVAAGLPVLDLFDVYPPSGRSALRVAPWDDHPNAEGHRIIAERLFRELATYLVSGAFEHAQSSRTN